MSEITIVPLGERKSRLQVNANGRTVRTHPRRYRLSSNERFDPATLFDDVALLFGFSTYAFYENDAGAVIRTMEITEEKTQKVSDTTFFTYLIELEYSSEMPEPQGDDPLSEPPKVRWSGNESAKAVFKDRDGNPVLNAANDYFFDPSLEKPTVHPVLTIIRNEPFFDSAFVFGYAGRINSADFYAAPAGTLRMKTPTAERRWYKGQVYWEVTYEFEYDEDGWQPAPLNQGLRELVMLGPGLGKRAIRDEQTGQPVRDPVPLYPDGSAIPSSELPEAANYLEKPILYEKDFNELGL